MGIPVEEELLLDVGGEVGEDRAVVKRELLHDGLGVCVCVCVCVYVCVCWWGKWRGRGEDCVSVEGKLLHDRLVCDGLGVRVCVCAYITCEKDGKEEVAKTHTHTHIHTPPHCSPRRWPSSR